MKHSRKIVAVVLCASVVFSMTACGTLTKVGNIISHIVDERKQEETTEDYRYTEPETEEKTEKKEISEGSGSAYISESNRSLVPEYEHYDATEFNADCEQLMQYAQNGDKDKALSLYDELYTELEYIDSLNTVISITYYEDVNNAGNEEEMEYMDELETDSADKFMTAGHSLAAGSLADSFREHLADDDMFNEYVDYVEMTEEEKELSKQETELCNEYSKLSDGLFDYSYVWGGHEFKLGDFYESDSDIYDYIETEDDYYQVLAGCMKDFNKEAGEIYLQLVQIRTRIAELNGYDSYADYADEQIYGRDYTAADLEKFETAVKNEGYEVGDYYSYLYYSLPDYDESSIEGFLDSVGKIVTSISPYADSAFKYFKENKLYSIGTDESRYDGGFTASFPYPEEANFIYYKLGGSMFDLNTLVHEMGHFTEGYLNGTNLVKTMSYDVAEIHSTGLEMLAYYMYDTVVDETDAQLLSGTALAEVRDSVVSGCVYDEWQRYVYAHPDMTLDEINDKFREINNEYDCGNEEYLGYQWALVNHNFESPLYYISYAVSAIMALQIWEQVNTSDFETAAMTWEKIVGAGTYSEFTETVKSAGLKPITDTKMISEILEDVDASIEQAVYMAYIYEYTE